MPTMEGDCDGMVAIVQGMMDAGLKVTMLDGRRTKRSVRDRSTGDMYAVPTSTHESNVRPIMIRKRPSTSTCTEPRAIMYKRNAGVQICDGRYASSYQMAHCKMVPTSPPVHLPEFPPQRVQPSSGLGNFEVGGCGSGESSYTPLMPVVPEVTYRNSFASPDRGSRLRFPGSSPYKRRISGNSLTRFDDTSNQDVSGYARNGLLRQRPTTSFDGYGSQTSQIEAFANSLRRYPMLSPDRSMSSDLVQRLITYTQAKNLSKSSSQSKDVRSVSRDRTPSPTGSYKRSPDRTTRHIQTYTRKPEQPTKDVTNVQNDKRSGAKKYKTVPKDDSYVRYKDNQLNQMYDYLRSTRPARRSRSGNPEVMYLSNVTKVIRETLKQIYSEDKPMAVMQMCPSMMSRYNMHKNKYHKQSTGQQSNIEASNVEMQATPTTSRCAPLLCLAPPHGSRPRKLCCLCHRPPPCSCIITPVPAKPVCPCPKPVKDYGKLLEEQICAWLCEIPVYINDSSQDKLKRHAMAMKLAETLKSFDEEDFENKAKDEILKCIAMLPMWYPGAKRDQEMFKEQIANSLLDRIKDLPRDQFDDEVDANMAIADDADILGDEYDDLPKDTILEPSQAVALRKMSAEFLQRIKEESDNAISEWVQEISDEIGYDLNEDKSAVQSLIQSLQALQKHDVSDPYVQNEIKNVIRGWLDTATAGRGQLDSNTKMKYTDKLLDKLVNINDAAKKAKKENIDEMFSEKVEKKLGRGMSGQEDLPTVKVTEKSARRFSGQFDKSSRKSDEQFDKSSRKSDEPSSEKPESREAGRESMDENYLIDEIFNLFERVTDAETQDPENKSLVKDLAEKIKNLLKDESKMQEEVQGDVLGLLTILFNRVNIASKPVDERINKFIKSLKTSPRPRKRWVSQDELQKSILDAISELPINEALRQLAPNDRKDVKYKIANISANNIGTLNTPDVTDTKKEIANVLVKDGMLQSIKAQNLAGDIIDRVRVMSVSSTKRTSFSQSYQKPAGSPDVQSHLRSSPASNISGFARMPSKTSLKQTLKKEVSSTLQKHKLKVKDKAQLEDDLTNLLSDEIVRGGSVNTRAEVISILNEAEVAHEKTINVTNELVGKARDMSAIFLSDADSKKSSFSRAAAFRTIRESKNIFNEPTINITTSTPKQSMEKKRLPSEIFKSPTPECTTAGQTWNSKRTQDTGEKKYMEQLETIIAEWMDELPLDLNATDNKGFKETMVSDLAADIVDRQKYLQLNPTAKTSDIEELEHLKYQVFKWLNKLMEADDLTNTIPRAKILMDRIKGLRVPSMIKPKKEDEILLQGEIPHFSDVLEDEISSWLREVPPNMVKIDERHQQQMVKELAQKIQQNKNDDDYDVGQEIEQWANKIITGNRRSIIKWSDLLRERLKNKGFAGDTSWVLAQDTSQFIEENLGGGMQEWLRNSPLYLNKSPEEQQQQDQLLQELAREMRIVIDNARPGEDIDELLLSEITKFLRKFPLTPEERSDPEFIAKTAGDLLDYLRGLQMFQDISVRHKSQSSDIQLVTIIEDWIGSLPINARKNSTEHRQFNTLKAEFISKIKQLRKQHVPGSDDSILREEIKKYLLLLPIEPVKRQDQEYLDDKIEELLNNIDIISAKNTTNQVIEEAVFNWSQNLPLKDGNTLSSIESKLNEFSAALCKTLYNEDLSNFDDKKYDLKEDIINFLRRISLTPSKQNYDAMNTISNDLIRAIKRASRRSKASIEERNSAKKAADLLYDNVEAWCERLPIPSDDTAEDEERIKTMKANLASKLINKIGELNMNPELFNDDFLYEDLLQDEIDELLIPLPKDAEFEIKIPDLKKDLIEKVIEANHKIREENAGHVYKQQLKDTITKTLPIESDLSTDNEATFELLKENVADAFINLHCLGGNEDLKQKYKRKINNEVDNFCSDYLKRNPNSPVDNKKLNKDLFKALRDVPLPNDESMRSEIGQARIKDVINEWMKDVPLKDQTGAEQLRTNKMVSVLAKKLHNIELEKANNPDLDTVDKMQTEIEKWMKKLPLSSMSRIEQLASDLVSNIQRSEDSRRFSASTRLSIDSFDEVDQICCRRTIMEKQQRSFHGNRCSRRTPSVVQLPSSSLTYDDKAYLQRIRERAQTTRIRAKTCRDVAICPLPMDASSQTEMRCSEEPDDRTQTQRTSISSIQECNQPADQQLASQTRPRTTCPRPCSIDSQYDAPQVVVKEYHWNSSPAPKTPRYQAPPLCVDPLYPRRRYISRDAQSQSFIPISSTRAFAPPAPRHAPSRSPCMTQTYEPQTPCRPNTYTPKPPCRAQNYASQPPCMSHTYAPQPCLPQSYSPQPARLSSTPPCAPRHDSLFASTPKRTSRNRDPFMPCFRPSRSSIIEDDDIDESPTRSYRSRPCLNERQSVDNMNHRSSDNKRHSRTDDYSVRFPVNENQWGVPCSRSPLVSDEDPGRGREGRCVFRSPRCYRGRRRQSPDRSCSKCCGYVCPFPSHLFFRQ